MSNRWLIAILLVLVLGAASWLMLSSENVAPGESTPAEPKVESSARAQPMATLHSEPRPPTLEELGVTPSPWNAGLPPELQSPPDNRIIPPDPVYFWNVTGRLIDADSGAPIAGAVVRLDRVEATSRADGRFELREVRQAEQSHLVVRHDFYYLEKDLELTADRDLGDIRLTMQTCIRGHVLRPDGRLADDAKVYLSTGSWEQSSDEKTTGRVPFDVLGTDTITLSAGLFTAQGIPPGRYVVIAISRTLSASEEQLVDTREASEALVELRLRPAGAIEGDLVDSYGSPLNGVTVNADPGALEANEDAYPWSGTRVGVPAQAGGGWPKPNQSVTVGGRFQLAPLPAGRYRVFVRFPRGDVSKEVEVRHGETARVHLREPRSATISGRVVAPNGSGIDSAKVRLEGSTLGSSYERHLPSRQPPDAVTNAQGEFHFDVVAGENYTLIARHRTHSNARRDVSAGDHGIVIMMEPRGMVSGRVVDEKSRPVSGASVTAGQTEATRTSDDGTFSLDNVLTSSGNGTLIVSADGYLPELCRFRLETSGGSTEVEVRLKPGALVDCRILDEAGALIEASEVICTDCRALGHRNEEGGRVIGPLPRGRHRLRAAGTDYRAAERDIEIDQEVRMEVEFHLVPGIALQGVVLGRTEEPIPGVQVDVQIDEPRSHAGAVSDDEGHFETGAGLEPGAAAVTVTRGGDRVLGRRKIVIVPEPSVQECTIRLDVDNIVLTGRVTEGGEPVTNARVELYQGEPWYSDRRDTSDQTDGNGRYEFDWLEPGPVMLLVRDPDNGGVLAKERYEIPDRRRSEKDLVLRGHSVIGTLNTEDVSPGSTSMYVFSLDHASEEEMISRVATITADDRFRFRALPSGRYGLVALHTPSGYARIESFEVRDDKDLGTVKLRPTGRLMIHVRPGGLATVSLLDDDIWGEIYSQVGVGLGPAKMNLPPGTYAVEVTRPEHQPIRLESLRVVANETTSETARF